MLVNAPSLPAKESASVADKSAFWTFVVAAGERSEAVFRGEL